MLHKPVAGTKQIFGQRSLWLVLKSGFPSPARFTAYRVYVPTIGSRTGERGKFNGTRLTKPVLLLIVVLK